MSDTNFKQSSAPDWPIAAILRGLCNVRDTWNIFAPDCEPFRGIRQILPDTQFVPTASRGVFLANDKQEPSVVFVPNRQLPAILNGLAKHHACERTHPLVLVVEDHPIIAQHIPPRQFLRDSGIATVEPCDMMEVEFVGLAAGRLAVATKTPIGIVAHHGLLESASSYIERETPESLSTRLHADTGDPTRLARRLELNRQRTLPSPGERGSVGFITVGLADTSLRYLISELRLLGRVPILNLRLVAPLDDVPIKRMLTRCHNLVVLEPRPGELEIEIMTIAERMRRDGEEVALVWGRELPPIDPEHRPICVPDDSIHPSVVARLIKHLLHEARPASEVELQLMTTRPSLPQRPTRRQHLGTAAAIRVLKETAVRVAKDQAEHSIMIDGEEVQTCEGQTVSIEIWGSSRFLSEGVAVVRSLSNAAETRVFLIWEGSGGSRSASSRDSALFTTAYDDKGRVERLQIDHVAELEKTIQQAIERDGETIIVVREGDAPRYDIERLSEVCKAIDARGFLEKNTISVTMSEMSDVRFQLPQQARSMKAVMPLETRIWSQWQPKAKNRLHVSLRPVMEQATVIRVKPPIRVVSHTDARLTPPQPIHANEPEWRVHIAGVRGDQLGVVGESLLRAGTTMGYETRCQSNCASVGAGRHAWTQILFTRPQTARTHRPLVACIPWGEADLLLGWDREETMRAVDPEGVLQVGSTQRTHAIVNTGYLDQQVGLLRKPTEDDGFVLEELLSSCNKKSGLVGDFSAWARYRFHNTRLGDLVQLGVAFQQGVIPVTVDAMNTALHETEERGFARSREAFDYGRRIALHPDAAWVPVDEEATIDLSRISRRYIRNIRRVGMRGKMRAEVAERLFARLQQELPDLAGSTHGREALFAAVVGTRRCILWGGEKTATTFVENIERVYNIDRAETGREFTRYCILVLAEVMLVRDPIYLARLARSPEIIRGLRSRLNVRKPRGDELHRRFLTRFELAVGKWRLHAEIRTSDWSSALISNIGRIIPRRWRGRRRDREVRDIVLQAVQLATDGGAISNQWLKKFEKLNEMAIDGSLHTASADELRLVVDGTNLDAQPSVT